MPMIAGASIAAGSRLGMDMATEVETLSRCVADLEILIGHLPEAVGLG